MIYAMTAWYLVKRQNERDNYLSLFRLSQTLFVFRLKSSQGFGGYFVVYPNPHYRLQ